MSRLSLVALSVFSILVLATGCNVNRSASSSTLPNDVNHSANGLKPLDDPANPYAGDYSEWDQQIYGALHQLQEEGQLSEVSQLAKNLFYEDGFHNFDTYIDRSGFLLPKLYVTKTRQDFYAIGTRQAGLSPFDGLTRVSVPVAISDEDYNHYLHEVDKIVSSYYRPIPSWLYANPPAGGAILYPNGDILCIGPLGSWAEFEEARTRHSSHLGESHAEQREPLPGPETSPESYWSDLHLYTEDGMLKARSNGTSAPIRLYVGESSRSGLGQSADQYWGTAEFEPTRDGYTIIRSRDTNKVLQVIDYDGTVYQGENEPPVRDLHNFFVVKPGQIKRFYEAQQ